MPRRNKRDNAKRAYRPQPYQDNPPLPEDYAPSFRKLVEIKPRTPTQYDYLEALRDEENHIVFAIGPAGTGKSMLATEYALEQYQLGNVKKIVITRPAVSVDEEHGFLKGTLIEKMAPWTRPILEIFKEHLGVPAVEKMLKLEQIDISPLAFMRGITYKDSIIVADEMQNATISQMKMLLTRIGDGSRLIVTGDLQQHDRGYEANGLKDFTDRLAAQGSEMIECIEFGREDIVRHPVVAEVLGLYGEE